MQIGISTANLYPTLVEEALSSLKGRGAEVTEVFLNTVSEVTPSFAAEMKRRADDAGIAIRSLHSYTSCFEPYLLFSKYERRFLDGLEVFKPIYETAAAVGADYVILHGDREPGHLTEEESIARFERLYDLGRTFGVTLLQENVVRFRASSPDYVRAMRRQLGNKAQFTLDLKQCRRSDVDVFAMIDAMAGAIRHVHISDATAEEDCLMPGKGAVRFPPILRALKDSGFDGALIIELYRHNFDSLDDFSAGTAALRQALDTL